MKSNIGKIGRLARLALAIMLLVYAYLTESWAGWCIFYQLIGKNSFPLLKK